MGAEHDTKRALLERLLDKSMVMVTVDARRPGVVVPDHLKLDAQLRLNLSWRFGLPMELTDDRVHATLTFGGVPFPCELPWSCIYLVVAHTTGEPFFFPSDAPAGLLEALPVQESLEPHVTDDKPRFEVVAGDEAVPPSDEPRTPPKRGHLRVVK